MIDQNLKNTIQEHMNSLPHDVQEAIHGSSWERKILDIGRRYGLHVDQLEILQTELSLAVLGLVDRDQFARETAREAGIARQTMDLIVVDINREIFESIRNHLKQTRAREEIVEQSHSLHEESVNSDTLSGLHSQEEEELRKHGLSFNFEEEQKIPVKSTLQTTVSEMAQMSPVLSTPLSVKTQTKPTIQSVSFQDILKTNQVEDEDVKTPQMTTVEISKVSNQKEPEIIGLNINPQNLPGAKTEIMQNKITESREPVYQKVDPYREPIT